MSGKSVTCSACGEEKVPAIGRFSSRQTCLTPRQNREAFSKNQIGKGREAKCKDCTQAPPAPAPASAKKGKSKDLLSCDGCGDELPASDFSKNQLSKAAARKCKVRLSLPDCVAWIASHFFYQSCLSRAPLLLPRRHLPPVRKVAKCLRPLPRVKGLLPRAKRPLPRAKKGPNRSFLNAMAAETNCRRLNSRAISCPKANLASAKSAWKCLPAETRKWTTMRTRILI